MSIPTARYEWHATIAWLFRHYLKVQWWRFALLCICMVVSSAATGVVALMLKPALEAMFRHDHGADVPHLGLVCAAILGSALVGGIARYIHTIALETLGQDVIHSLRRDVLYHILRADLSYLQQTHVGRLTLSCMQETSVVRDAVVSLLAGSLQDVVSFLVLFGAMLYRDWELTMLSLIVVPVLALCMARLGKRARQLFDDLHEDSVRLTARITDTLFNIRLVKIYGAEESERDRISASFAEQGRRHLHMLHTKALLLPLNELLTALTVVAAMVVGMWRAQSGALTMPVLSSFLMALIMSYRPLKRLTGGGYGIQEGLSAAMRLRSLLDTPRQICDKPGAHSFDDLRGDIRFERLSFAYDGRDPCLKGIDLTIPAGSVAAIVGPSGAGKSTLVNLIPRFYDPLEGRVLVDGVDIRDATLASLRSHIAIVTQETLLFDDSVANNIAFGRENTPRSRIEAAARAAVADDFIRHLPQGYDTPIGANGVKLSGGQRQRIAIARALVKDARILILDEATSSLDNRAEAEFKAALSRVAAGRTTIVIAHRLSTIVNADRIFVLADGRIVEAGTHADLLRAGGSYAELYRAQEAESPDPDLAAVVAAAS